MIVKIVEMRLTNAGPESHNTGTHLAIVTVIVLIINRWWHSGALTSGGLVTIHIIRSLVI